MDSLVRFFRKLWILVRREKFNSELTISLARKVCRAIFSSSGAFSASPEICFASICA